MNRLILLFMGVLWLCACLDSPQPVAFDGRDHMWTQVLRFVHGVMTRRSSLSKASTSTSVGARIGVRCKWKSSFRGAEVTYNVITGYFRLHCPNRRCDHWDRYGSFGVVENPGTDSARYIEIDRFITPYRVGFEWQSDLTDLRPL